MSDEEMRAALAAVIDGLHLTSPAHALVVADALLPVVRKIAADHLRAAANEWPLRTMNCTQAAAHISARADALDPA